jgi:glycosyltransferase involved in cell wall biosynthesis
MRVLHVIPSISPRRGGPSAVIFPMVGALRARGIEVEIATSDEDAESSYLSSVPREQYYDVPVWYFSRWSPFFRPLRDYTYSPRFVAWLKRNVGSYDLIHVHAIFSHIPSMAMRVARESGVPYISRPLGQLGHWPLRQSAQRKRLYLQWLEHRNLRDAGSLHFTSESERGEAAAVVSVDRGAVIPHGIDLPEIHPDARARLRAELGLTSDQKAVLFLGRLHAKKGLDLLVQALADLPEPRPVLLIAGEGDHRGEIERLAIRMGVDRQLRWLGHVTGERKQLCLQGADLFALTSHHENFGVAVLEALAAGTPVLISNRVALADEIAEPVGHGRAVGAGSDPGRPYAELEDANRA